MLAALNIRGHILQARQRQSAKERTQARNAEKDRQKRQDRIDHDLRVTHLPTKSEFEARETARRVLSAKLMDCTKRGVLEQVIGSGGLHGWMEKTITNNDAQTVPTGYDWSWRQKQYRPEERMSDRIDRMVGGMIGEDQEELQEQLRLDREAYIASQAKASKHGNRQPLGDARGHGAVAKTAVARSTHPIGVGPRSAVVKTNGRGSEKNVLFENGIISHLPDDEIINRNRKHRRRASGNPEAQDGSDDRALASDVALFLNKEEEDPAGLLRDLSGSIEEDVDTNSLAKHVKQRSCNGKAGNQDGTSDEDDFDAASSVIADTRLVSKELVGGDQAAFEDSLAVEWLQIFLHEFTSDGFSTAVDQSQSHSVAHAKMAKARVPVISSANVGKPAEELGNSSTPSPAPSQTTQPRKQDSSCSSDENTYDVGNSHDSVCSGSQVEADDTFEKEMQDSAEDYDADMGQEEWKMFTTANTRTTRPAQSFAPSSPRRSQTNPEFWSLGFFDAGQPQVTQVIQDLTKDTYDIEKNADEDARNHDWALAHNREEGKIPLPKLMEFAHGDIDYKVYTYDCLDDYLEQHEAHQPMSIDPTNSYVMSTYCPQDYDGEAWVFSREEFDPRNRDDTYDSNEFSVPSNATTNENHPHCPIRNEQGGGGGQTSGGPQNTCIDRRDWAPQNWETIKLAPLSLDSGEKIPWKTVLDSYKVTSGLFKSFRSNAESIKCQPRETLDQRLQLDNQLKELASQRQHLKNSIQQTRYAEHHHAQQMARHVELKRRENTNSAAERQDPKLEGCQKADLIRMFQRRIDDPKLDRYNLNIVDPTKPLPIPNLDFSPYNQGSSVANSATPNNMTTTLLESASDPPVTILQSPPVQSTQSPPQKGDEVSSMQTNSSTDRKPPTPTGSTVHKSPDFIGYWLSLRKMSIFDSGDKPSSIPGFIDQIEGGLEVLLKLVNNPYVANSTSDELFELEAKYNKLARKYAEAASQPSSSPYCGFGSKMSKIGADFETIGGILQKLMPPATQDDTQAKDKSKHAPVSMKCTADHLVHWTALSGITTSPS